MYSRHLKLVAIFFLLATFSVNLVTANYESCLTSICFDDSLEFSQETIFRWDITEASRGGMKLNVTNELSQFVGIMEDLFFQLRIIDSSFYGRGTNLDFQKYLDVDMVEKVDGQSSTIWDLFPSAQIVDHPLMLNYSTFLQPTILIKDGNPVNRFLDYVLFGGASLSSHFTDNVQISETHIISSSLYQSHVILNQQSNKIENDWINYHSTTAINQHVNYTTGLLTYFELREKNYLIHTITGEKRVEELTIEIQLQEMVYFIGDNSIGAGNGSDLGDVDEDSGFGEFKSDIFRNDQSDSYLNEKPSRQNEYVTTSLTHFDLYMVVFGIGIIGWAKTKKNKLFQ